MMPVRGAVPLRGRGGAADLVVSAPGILGAEGGQQGALARLDVLVKWLHSSKGCERARWSKCPEGAGWRAASNRMASAVQAGEGGGPADVHAVAQRAVRRGSESGRVPHGKISPTGGTDVQLDFKRYVLTCEYSIRGPGM